MITVGSVSREKASESFEFLAASFRGRRKAIKEFTHLAPDYVFWIFPDGKLFDARDAHKKTYPKVMNTFLRMNPITVGSCAEGWLAILVCHLSSFTAAPKPLQKKAKSLANFYLECPKCLSRYLEIRLSLVTMETFTGHSMIYEQDKNNGLAHKEFSRLNDNYF